MKFKSVFAAISIGLLVMTLAVAFSFPVAAEMTGFDQMPSDKMVAMKTSGGPVKLDKYYNETVPNTALEYSKIDKDMAASKSAADYWFDKGALCATYGNDPAAIKFFQKAISLDPNHSKAYFEQGISYGQLGEFDKAITLIDKAIDMEPQNGLYLYGRGRVYLIAGKQDLAMEDFKKASELDDEDAQAYLEQVAQK